MRDRGTEGELCGGCRRHPDHTRLVCMTHLSRYWQLNLNARASIYTDKRIATIRAGRVAEHKVAINVVQRYCFCSPCGTTVHVVDRERTTVADETNDSNGRADNSRVRTATEGVSSGSGEVERESRCGCCDAVGEFQNDGTVSCNCRRESIFDKALAFA